MRVTLIPHPDTPAAAARAVAVEIGPVSGRQLRLRYVVTGESARLALPEAASPERADELWRGTCFEAFAANAAPAYREFNFSPSTQWAAYDFDFYRAGRRDAPVLAPRIEGRCDQEHYELHVAFDLPGEGQCRLALAAVIEETTGLKSYWALKHPPGKPDFHKLDGFVLELP